MPKQKAKPTDKRRDKILDEILQGRQGQQAPLPGVQGQVESGPQAGPQADPGPEPAYLPELLLFTARLTREPPVQYNPEEWPLSAIVRRYESADGKVCTEPGHDHDLMNEELRGFCWMWELSVRTHADGRALVHAVFTQPMPRHVRRCYAGEYDEVPGALCYPKLADMIRRVCQDMRKLWLYDDPEHAARWREIAIQATGQLPKLIL